MQRVSVPDAIVELLVAHGVTHVPGVPGGQTLYIMDSLRRRAGIDYVLARHENAAACMADGQARIRNGLGAFLVTTGPGVTNALTGVGGALRDSSPVLALTVNNRSPHILRGDNQDADHVAIMDSLTKFSRCVTHPSQVIPVLRDAIRTALNGSPGPVHVDFLRDVIEEAEIEVDPVVDFAPIERLVSLPDESALEAAARRLDAASRPVIWAGRGAVAARSSAEIVALAEQLHAPVVTTFTAMGLMPPDHPLAFAVHTRTGTQLAQEALGGADLVLAVGNRLDAISTTRWSMEMPAIVQIDVEPFEIGRNYPVEIGLQGDAAATTAALTKRLQAADHRPAAAVLDWVGTLAEARDVWVSTHRTAYDTPDQAPPLNPKSVMAALNAVLPEDLLVAADAGNPGLWTHLLDLPSRYGYLKPVGFANMGHSLPAIIGAKLADPGRPALCVIGDGSLGMCLGELETLARLGLGVVVCVLNDSAYGNILQEQDHLFGAEYPNTGVQLGAVDFAKVAEGMGVEALRVDSTRQLAERAKDGFARNIPLLLDVVVDGNVSVFEAPF